MSFIKKVFSWIKGKKNRPISKVENMDIDIENIIDKNDFVKYSTIICDELIKLSTSIKKNTEEFREVSETVDVVQKIQDLDKDKIKEFETIVGTIESANKERETLKTKISIPENEVLQIQNYENDIEDTLKEIDKAEEKQRMAKSDMDYLDGEKEYLYYQKERLEKTGDIIRGLTIGLIIVIAISTLVLVIMYSFYDQTVLVPAMIIFVASLFVVTWIYIFKRYVTFELKQNVRKQTKAVELLNKAKLKYVHHTRYLEYVYKKYKIKGGDELRYRVEKYNHYKTTSQRYKRISEYASGTMERFERFIELNGINNIDFILENLENIKTKKTRLSFYEEAVEQKEILASKIEELESNQRSVMNMLNELKMKDSSGEDIVEGIIEQKMSK